MPTVMRWLGHHEFELQTAGEHSDFPNWLVRRVMRGRNSTCRLDGSHHGQEYRAFYLLRVRLKVTDLFFTREILDISPEPALYFLN